MKTDTNPSENRPLTLGQLDKKRVNEAKKFGKIDENGKVYTLLKDKEGKQVEKYIGQYSLDDIDSEMTLYVRRFIDFETRLDLFEKRVSTKESIPDSQIDDSLKNFKTFLNQKNAIGNWQLIENRVHALEEYCATKKVENAQYREQIKNESLATLTKVVVELEKILQEDHTKIVWKNAIDKLNENLKIWDETKSFVKLPKKDTEELYGRLISAKNIIYTKRRETRKKFEEQAKSVKVRKNALIEEVNRIKDSNNFDATKKTLARLLDQWKKIGRGDRKTDDKQWKQFLDARQAFFDRIPKEKVIVKKKEELATWENDFSELGSNISGLDGLANLAKALKQ